MSGFLPSAHEVLGYKVPIIRRDQLPPTIPLQINGTAPRKIIFPAEFSGYALDIVVDNFSAATMSFALNGSSTAKRIVAGGAFSAGDQVMVALEIVTGTDWEVTFSLLPLSYGVK